MASKANEVLHESGEAPSGSQQPAAPPKEKRMRKKAAEAIEAKPQILSSTSKKHQNSSSVDDSASYVPNGVAAQVGVTVSVINLALGLELHRISAGLVCQSAAGLGSGGFVRFLDERCSARSAAAGGLLHA